MRIDKVVTSGTFSLDGGTWDVDNNVWVYGDDTECVVIDAAHDAAAIAAAVGDRACKAILCTHAHDDHVNVAWELAGLIDAPVLLHPDDRVLWDMTHSKAPDGDLVDGSQVLVGSGALTVRHTPGHAPGAVCFVGGVRLQRRHAVLRRARRHGPVLQRLPDDPRVHLRLAALAPTRDGRAHRPRRRHDHRCGGRLIRPVGGPRALTLPGKGPNGSAGASGQCLVTDDGVHS